MKKFLIALLLTLSIPLHAQPSEDIKSWKEIIPNKGYVLSLDLQNEKHCLKIWSKQIYKFKEKNPHVKNPNKLSIKKKIWVQSCTEDLTNITTDPEFKSLPREEKKEILNQWFLGLYAGYHGLGKGNNDTEKDGHNLGVKAGYSFIGNNQTLSFSLGLLRNQLTTKDRQNDLGAYRVETNLITLETDWLFHMGSKFKMGPVLTLIAGEDVSFTEFNDKKTLGAFGGVDALFSLTKKMQLELNVQQRIDSWERFNMMGNLGLRFNF